METTENHKEPSRKKSSFNFLGQLIWWNVDKEDIQKQVAEYKSNILHTTRGVFAISMIGWVLITNLLHIINWIPNNKFIISLFIYEEISPFTMFIYFLLVFLIYKGKKIPIFIMMFYVTLDRGYALYKSILSGQVDTLFWIMLVFWWSVFMRMLYVSYKVEVERLREHNHDNKIGSVNLFLKKPLNVVILVVCIVVITYFGILITKEVQPKSSSEKQMECLKLGSDFARRRCLLIINNK